MIKCQALRADAPVQRYWHDRYRASLVARTTRGELWIVDSESISVVLAALTAAGATGVAAGVQSAASDAVSRAYQAFKDKLVSLCGSAKVEAAANGDEAAVKDLDQQLVQVDQSEGSELRALAMSLLAELPAAGRASAQYFLNVRGLQYNDKGVVKPVQVNTFH